MNCNYCIIKRISALYDMFDKETKNCIIKSEAAEMPLCQDHGVGKFPALFCFIGNFDFLKDKRNTRSSNVSSINTCVGMTIRRWSDQKI